MNKIDLNLCGLSLALLSVTAATEAGPVLKARELCFQVGEVKPKEKNWTLKIKPQQSLPSHAGSLVEVVGLAHGIQVNEPSDTSAVQLTGAASFVTPGFGEPPFNTVRVALIGNTFSRHDTESRIVSWNVSLVLQPEIKGTSMVGRVIGFKTYSPLAQRSDGENSEPMLSTDPGFHINLLDDRSSLIRTPTREEVNASLVEISCSKF